MDPWLLSRLACPRDRAPLTESASGLTCPSGHTYPVVDGVPVMLTDDAPATLWVLDASLKASKEAAQGERSADPYFIDTLGVYEHERKALIQEIGRAAEVDPVVRYLVMQTCGYLYKPLVGKIAEYPIPHSPLAPSRGESVLDIGCSWGRWSVAAARLGYEPVGIDPSLGAVLAARRVAKQLGVSPRFVVGDARCLPFHDGVFDAVFSYGVLQHFSKENARTAFGEVRRVVKGGGTTTIQMAAKYGIRSFYHQARRGFREGERFEVRYWAPSELEGAFRSILGPTTFFADGYFGLGMQRADIRLLPLRYRPIVYASEMLRKASRVVPGLWRLADSIWARSVREAA